jgi:hypothetical protein
MIKELKEIEAEMELHENVHVNPSVNPAAFIVIVAPLIIKICELIKVITGKKGDKILDGIIVVIQGLQLGTLIIKPNT